MKNLIAISLSLLLSLPGVKAFSSYEEQVEAPITFTIPQQIEYELSRYEYLLNDEEGSGANAIASWIKRESADEGIKFYNDLAEVDTPTVDENFLRNILDSFYVEASVFNYCFNNLINDSDSVNDLRCLLDHVMPMKDDFNAFVNSVNFDDLDQEENLLSLYTFSKNIYDSIITTIDDTYYQGSVEESTSYIFGKFKNYLIKFDEEKEVSLSDAFIKNFATITSLDPTNVNDKIEDLKEKQTAFSLIDFIDKFEAKTALGFTSDELDEAFLLGTPEGDTLVEEYAESSMNVVFFINEIFADLLEKCYCTPEFAINLNSNLGPVSYKILDFIEACTWDDYPNICIMALEIHTDLIILYDYVLCEHYSSSADSLEAIVAMLELSVSINKPSYQERVDLCTPWLDEVTTIIDEIEELMLHCNETELEGYLTRLEALKQKLIDLIGINDDPCIEHIDEDHDGHCDRCGEEVPVEPDPQPDPQPDPDEPTKKNHTGLILGISIPLGLLIVAAIVIYIIKKKYSKD